MNIFLIYQNEYNKSTRRCNMDKFLPKKPEKEVTTIRIPKSVLEEIDKKATAFELSRNEFINQCLIFALENME